MIEQEKEFYKQIKRILDKNNTKQPLSFEEKDILANLLISHGLPIVEEFEEFWLFGLIPEAIVDRDNQNPKLKINEELYNILKNNIWLKIKTNELLKIYWSDIKYEIDEEIKKIHKDSKLKNKNKSETILSKLYFHFYARWVFILVKHKLEKAGSQEFEVIFKDRKVIINFKTLIHIYIRHYGSITKDYNTLKSFFNQDLEYKNLLESILDILIKIENSIHRNEVSDNKIYFNFKGLDYSIYIDKNIVATFFPIEDKKKLLKIQRDFVLKRIDKDLQIYINKS